MSDLNVQSQVSFETKPFSFTGNTKEYFGIWIVNLLLSIVTVGIYTAWAKVMRLRYFYANTWLDGHNFEYHAKPMQILIGRIIVVAYLIFTQVMANIYPIAGLILILPYFILLPWVINKALAFNARMTSYRNVRFGFEGTYWRSLGIFILMPLAVSLAGGFIAPIASQMAMDYLGNNTRYGNLKFETKTPLGALYGNFGATIVFIIAGFAIMAFAVFGVFAGTGAGFEDLLNDFDPDGATSDIIATIGVFGGIIVLYSVIIFAFIFYNAGVRNVAYNHTLLDGVHRFKSTLSRIKYVWIIFSNFVAVILTVGLL